MDALIRQMGHVTLAVPEPGASAADLVEMTGLRVTGQSGSEVMLSSNRRRYEIVLRKGPGPACWRSGSRLRVRRRSTRSGPGFAPMD